MRMVTEIVIIQARTLSLFSRRIGDEAWLSIEPDLKSFIRVFVGEVAVLSVNPLVIEFRKFKDGFAIFLRPLS